jgi:phosphoglycolate phosphatase
LYKLAIFDFDGTLVDSAPGIVQVMKEVVDEMGFSAELLERWSHMIGIPLVRQAELLFPEKDNEFHERLADIYRDRYDGKAIEICPLFPGLQDMLRLLTENGVSVTVATSKRRHLVEQVVDYHSLTDYFKLIVGAADVTHHKPHPESVHITMEKFGAKSEEVVVIGDSSFDLDMARNAGVDGIGVTTGIHTRELLKKSNPRYIVDGLHEVTPLILNGRMR